MVEQTHDAEGADPATRDRRTAGYRPEGIDDSLTGDAALAIDPAALPQLGIRGTVRVIWRQLTSMRVALFLLMLLAVAAVPGSVFPQNRQDPAGVAQYIVNNPTLGPWMARLGFFDVYTSVWFSAIYILLFVSLIGCVLPRVRAHLHALRSAPPRTPRRFTRFPARGRYLAPADEVTPEHISAIAVRHLRRRFLGLPTFRVATAVEPDGALTVSAERGYVRESGNLLFHVSLLGLLISFGTGQLLEYRGQAIVIEGRGFANAVVDYDTFESGAFFDEDSLVPFSLTLDAFRSTFRMTDAKPQDFEADVTIRETDGTSREESIKVNKPLVQSGAKIYLQGNGYAPQVTVRDAAGAVVFAGPVPFLPQDGMYTSHGVIKVPDVTMGEQIGLIGFLLPTAEITNNGARSVFPDPINPVLVLTVYHGNLGLDSGVPQNVYRLVTDDLTQSLEDDGTPVTLLVGLGATVDLPDGLGSIEFTELPRFVALDMRHDPSLVWVLGFALGALLGVSASLFTPRRRVWVRVRTEDTPMLGPDGTATGEAVRRTVVEVAGLARGDDTGLQGEVDSLLRAFPVPTPKEPDHDEVTQGSHGPLASTDLANATETDPHPTDTTTELRSGKAD